MVGELQGNCRGTAGELHGMCESALRAYGKRKIHHLGTEFLYATK
jgi:hypothetical protein